MEPIDIRILLMRAHKSQNGIAKKLGITQGFVAQVILGYRKTRYVQEAIAKAAGRPVEELFPNKPIPLDSGFRRNDAKKRKAA